MADDSNTSPSTTPPAGGTTDPQGGQQTGQTGSTAPAGSDPQGGQTAPTAGQTDPQGGQQSTTPATGSADPGKGGDGGKTFTQSDLDRIITDRLTRDREQQRKQWANALGIDDGSSPPDPAEALKAAQGEASKAQTRADKAEARSLALAAGVKPERVETFLRLVDVSGALDGVDRAKDSTVTEALTGAVSGALETAPEFKGAALPATSGGDRQQNGGTGKRQWTRAEIEGMSQAELANNADELAAAAAEGRIQ